MKKIYKYTTKGKLMDQAACDTYKAKNVCDADSDCSWCISAAVPSRCNTMADAKKLPPAVFHCDLTKEDKEPIIEESKEDCKFLDGEDICNAYDSCAWCFSKDFSSGCFTMADA